MTPRGVLWDVGNVVVRWDPRTLYSKIFPDSVQRDRFLAEVCTMAWHGQHDLGRPFADGIAELSARFPEHAEAIAAWRGRWWEMFSGTIRETEDAIEALAARGVPQFGLSNMSSEIWGGVKAMSPALDLLADIVISAEEGLIKPDPRIYQIACARAGMAPNDLLFIDDSPANIEAARALGFDVHLFVDPAALRPVIEARGLL